MQKCVWSGIKSEEVIEIIVPIRNMLGFGQKVKPFWVLPKHEKEFREFAAVNFSRGPRFVSFILSTVLLIHVAIMLVGLGMITEKMLLITLGIMIIIQGLLILMFPHANLDQTQMLSLRTAKKVGIGVSVFVIFVGISLLIASFYSVN